MTMTTVWVTKWALETGRIFPMEPEEIEHGYAWGCCGPTASDRRRLGSYAPNEWSRTPSQAGDRVEDIRRAEIASLETQLAKLRDMTFEVEE